MSVDKCQWNFRCPLCIFHWGNNMENDSICTSATTTTTEGRNRGEKELFFKTQKKNDAIKGLGSVCRSHDLSTCLENRLLFSYIRTLTRGWLHRYTLMSTSRFVFAVTVISDPSSALFKAHAVRLSGQTIRNRPPNPFFCNSHLSTRKTYLLYVSNEIFICIS